jgi:hypothetical protein
MTADEPGIWAANAALVYEPDFSNPLLGGRTRCITSEIGVCSACV